MSQDPVQEFLEAAQQSGLLSAVDVATLSHAMHETGATTRQDVAARLVDQNVLTPFQAEQLLAGHGRVPSSLDPHNPDFLAPPRTADLSTYESQDGLPNYIGAVPPNSVEPWDWDKTLKARAGLTDSAP